MVVVEVPLWVAHKKSGDASWADSGGGGGAGGIHPPGGPGTTPGASTETADPRLLSNASRAVRAAELWQPGTKGPVYGLDFSPDGTCFATGGGDGAVRVWNAADLFGVNRRFQGQGGGILKASIDPNDGAVVSADGSSSSSGDEGEDDGSDKNGNGEREDRDNNHRHPSQGGRRPSASAGSIGSSSNKSAMSSDSSPVEEVHDLTAVVRRKGAGDASAVASPSTPLRLGGPLAPPTETGASGLPLGLSPSSRRNSPSKNHHNPHHHHRRLITTLTGHSGHSVLAVRFSTHGHCIATGGDDGMVMVYTVPTAAAVSEHALTAAGSSSAVAATGGGGTYWPRKHICSGHNLDVIDLAWAPDDSVLVSCSLDSHHPICVWTVGHTTTGSSSSLRLAPFRVLGANEHTSTVRGVTFDPAGSYFATSGDDPALCVWRAHDDWGLEARITDIFGGTNSAQSGTAPSTFAAPTFVRRLSWSTDGTFVCCTNAVVKHRHVAATVNRQGWESAATSKGGSQSSASAAANLVGHKQPVVVCRHSPQLLLASDGPSDVDHLTDSGTPPTYATLLALGDKQGFVTVWTTKQARPVFKLQCASRTTVTDLAWGATPRNPEMPVLLVSQLDGAITAIQFQRGELPPALSVPQRALVFQLKYGMDATTGPGGIPRLLGRNQPQANFVESALAVGHQEADDDDDGDNDQPPADDSVVDVPPPPPAAPLVTTTVGGKKRVRPVLVAVGASDASRGPTASPPPVKKSKSAASVDPLQDALAAADKAAAAVPPPQSENRAQNPAPIAPSPPRQSQHQPQDPAHDRSAYTVMVTASDGSVAVALPYNKDRVHAVDLPMVGEASQLDESSLGTATLKGCVAECTNSLVPLSGQGGQALIHVDVVLRRDGQPSWRDSIPGTHCCAVAASHQFLAVGTVDGTIQLYGASPTMGWKSGHAFRSHPPLVVGYPVVTLRLRDDTKPSEGANDDGRHTHMLVVNSNGRFSVYNLIPTLQLLFKGSLVPAINHMSLSCRTSAGRTPVTSLESPLRLPEVIRVQFTPSGGLLALLGSSSDPEATVGGTARSPQAGSNSTSLGCVGGSLQAYVYDHSSELWMRMADSRFVLSDFYSGLPSKSKGPLARLDDSVRLGSMHSATKAGHRLGGDAILRQGDSETLKFLTTRSHCEDRMACALFLQSKSDFQQWLASYIRTLAQAGDAESIRVLTDAVLHIDRTQGDGTRVDSHWWLTRAFHLLGLERQALVKSMILPELRKNLALQRLTNEIALEVS